MFREPSPLQVSGLSRPGPCQSSPTPTTARGPGEQRPVETSRCSSISDPPAMEDMDQSPLVSSSSDSPPRPQPPFKYQFVRDPEDEEEDEEEEDEEDEDEDLEELEVLERKPAAGLSAAPVPPAAAAVPGAPLLDFGSDFVPPAPRGPLPTAPPAAPERPPSWDPSPTSPAGPAPSLPSAAAASPSKLPEDDEPPARPPPPPPAGVSPQAEPAWTPPAPAPAAPPSTPAAPKRRGSSGSVGECRALRPAQPRAAPRSPPSFVCTPRCLGRSPLPRPEGLCPWTSGRRRPPWQEPSGAGWGGRGNPGLFFIVCLGVGEHVHPACSRPPPSGPYPAASRKLGTRPYRELGWPRGASVVDTGGWPGSRVRMERPWRP